MIGKRVAERQDRELHIPFGQRGYIYGIAWKTKPSSFSA